MNRQRTPLSTFRPARRTPGSFLTISALSLLLLTACGSGSDGTAESSVSASQQASVSATASTQASSETSASTPSEAGETASKDTSSSENQASESESALPEANSAAEALSDATEVAADAEEVQQAETLYGDVQEVFAALEPAVAGSNANALENSDAQDQETEATEAPAPQHVSDETIQQLEKHATGSALDQYIATAVEYAVSGWRTEGKPTVVGTPKMAEGEYQGKPAKILEVCLDSTDVKLLNSQGKVISTSQYPRSLNIFTLIEDGGAWKIASHDFPNNADC